MAFWQKKSSKYVFVYTRKDDRQVPLPRKMTKHLDGQPDHNIEAWVRQYELQYEGRERLAKIAYDGTELSKMVQSWLAYLASRRKSKTTIKEYERMIMRYVIPFFLEGDTPLTDPQQWPGKSVRMLGHLQGIGLSESQIVACNKALRGFYNYLSEEGRVQNGIQLKLRSPIKEVKATPLPRTLSPEDILKFAKDNSSQPDVKLMALVGYFFSLRPQEIFAVQKSDFAGGSQVTSLECSKTMKKIGCYDRLAIHVQRQKTNWTKTLSEPKANSKGWVCCFNQEAARLIVGLIKEVELILFDQDNRNLYRIWEKDGLEGVTLKDLRRGSLYWLGHNTDIQPLELMKHARHKKIDTTMLYVRRPEEEVVMGVLDLDA